MKELIVNNTICVCGHVWVHHVYNGKTGACSFNQKICDCWIYDARKVDRRVIFDLLDSGKGGTK